VQSVTSAQRGLSEDLSMRTRRYLLMMGTRTVCFGLAIVIDHWSRWVLAFLAVVLPYFGVVGANAGRERTRDAVPVPVLPTRPALTPSIVATPASDDDTPAPSAAPGFTPDQASDNLFSSRVP
jgi:hypothetical protein